MRRVSGHARWWRANAIRTGPGGASTAGSVHRSEARTAHGSNRSRLEPPRAPFVVGSPRPVGDQQRASATHRSRERGACRARPPRTRATPRKTVRAHENGCRPRKRSVPRGHRPSLALAEGEGFEPSMPFARHTRFPDGYLVRIRCWKFDRCPAAKSACVGQQLFPSWRCILRVDVRTFHKLRRKWEFRDAGVAYV